MTRMEYFLTIAIVTVAGLGAWALFGGHDGQIIQRAIVLLIGN